MKRHAGVMATLLFCLQAQAYCFHEAGARYQIDPLLLKAIATQESGLNARAIHRNKDKQGRVVSWDYGLMQINSTHLPALKKLGVIRGQEDLLNQPCLNVHVGAWILAQHLRTCGVTWACLGSYNAGFHPRNEAKRLHYARKIYARYWRYPPGQGAS